MPLKTCATIGTAEDYNQALIRRSVREIAFLQLQSPITDDKRFVETLSLLRAMFPEDYIKVVKDWAYRIGASEQILDRVLFHLDTIDVRAWELERKEVIQALLNALTRGDHSIEPRVIRQQRQLEGLDESLMSVRVNADATDKIHALSSAMRSHEMVHDVIPVLAEIAKIPADRLEELNKIRYFYNLIGQIEADAIPFLQKDVYPLLDGMADVIDIELRTLKLLDNTPKDYFVVSSAVDGTSLPSDIDLIRSAFRSIDSGTQKHQALRQAMQAANRALGFAFLPKSNLAKIVESLQSLTLRSLLSDVENAFKGFLRQSLVTTDSQLFSPSMPFNENTRVLCPKTISTHFVGLIKSNLEKHVLSTGVSPSTLEISISVTFMSQGSKRYAVLRITNNGPRVSSKVNPSFHSRNFNRRIQCINAKFTPAIEAEPPWGCTTTLQIRIFGDTHNESTDC